MAVNFTPNIALAKPTDAELAANWVNGTELQDDNNVILETETDIVLSSYTPTLIGAAVNPSSGAGARNGEYQEFQGYIFGNFVINFVDPGIAAGTGEYGISLPFECDGTFHSVGTALNTAPGAFSCIGEGFIFENGSVATSGTTALDVLTIAGTSYVRLITETHAGKTSRMFRDANPFTVANGDSFAGSFFYKRV
jgi:hypothetical protein